MIKVNIIQDQTLINNSVEETDECATTRRELQRLQKVLEKVTGTETELLTVKQDLRLGEVAPFLDFVAMEKLLDDYKKSGSGPQKKFNEFIKELIPDINLDELVEMLQKLVRKEASGEEPTTH